MEMESKSKGWGGGWRRLRRELDQRGRWQWDREVKRNRTCFRWQWDREVKRNRTWNDNETEKSKDTELENILQNSTQLNQHQKWDFLSSSFSLAYDAWHKQYVTKILQMHLAFDHAVRSLTLSVLVWETDRWTNTVTQRLESLPL